MDMDMDNVSVGGKPGRRSVVLFLIVAVFIIPIIGGYGEANLRAAFTFGSVFSFVFNWLIPGWIAWALVAYLALWARRNRSEWQPRVEQAIGKTLDEMASYAEPYTSETVRIFYRGEDE